MELLFHRDCEAVAVRWQQLRPLVQIEELRKSVSPKTSH